MKRLITFFAIIILAACSSGSKKNSIDDITNKDFGRARALRYQPAKDVFVSKPGNNEALSKESIGRLEFFKGELPTVSKIDRLNSLCIQEQFDEAKKIIANIALRYRNFPSFWNALGICSLQQRKFRHSLLYFNKSIELSKGYTPALNNIGVYYLRTQDPQKARVAFEKAIQSSRYANTPRLNLATLYLRYGLLKNAGKYLRAFESRESKDIDVNHTLSYYYLANGENNKALMYLNRIPAAQFDRFSYGIHAAQVYLQAGNLDKAKSAFKSIDKPTTKTKKKFYQAVEKRLEGSK